jgi:hypothetical protein
MLIVSLPKKGMAYGLEMKTAFDSLGRLKKPLNRVKEKKQAEVLAEMVVGD